MYRLNTQAIKSYETLKFKCILNLLKRIRRIRTKRSRYAYGLATLLTKKVFKFYYTPIIKCLFRFIQNNLPNKNFLFNFTYNL